MGTARAHAAAVAAMLRAGRRRHLILLFLGLLLASLHRALVLWDDTLRPHAHGQALLEAALLALAPHVHVHLAGPSELAAVHGTLGDAPPEEPLAALAG